MNSPRSFFIPPEKVIFSEGKKKERGEVIGQFKIIEIRQCVKSIHIRSFSGPHFPAFGHNTESSEYGRISRSEKYCSLV